jgi:hypothetical protein
MSFKTCDKVDHVIEIFLFFKDHVLENWGQSRPCHGNFFYFSRIMSLKSDARVDHVIETFFIFKDHVI